MIYRQGDVLIVSTKKIPNTAKPIERENGAVILAHGEATGHAHAFRGAGVRMFRDDGTNGGGYLQVDGPDAKPLTHEEHTTIHVPPGNYRVIRQREYSPEAIRNVAD